MRGHVEGLASPHPLLETLPAILQDDAFLQRFLPAFDEMLAPVQLVLDDFPALLDPMLCPPDVLVWLAGWVGVAIDENWPADRQRVLVRDAVTHHRWRGTLKALREQVRLATGAEPTVSDSGGVTWSTTPGTPLPGRPVSSVEVDVTVSADDPISEAQLDAIVAAIKPAHAWHRVTLRREGTEPPATPPTPPEDVSPAVESDPHPPAPPDTAPVQPPPPAERPPDPE